MKKGVLIIIAAITITGRTNNTTWKPELSAIPIDRSSFPILACIIEVVCSETFPAIPTIIVPAHNNDLC
jgi:hypothetical protein